MTAQSESPVADSFPSIRTYQHLATGNFDELYRVRDLDQDVWRLARIYLNPLAEDRIDEVQQQVESVRAVEHESIIPISRHVVSGNHLAVCWEYRDAEALIDRIRREFNPRRIARMLQSIVDAVAAAQQEGVRCEYLSVHDVLVDIDDQPLLTAGTFSHLLSGKGDTTAGVDDYQRRVLNRIGAMLLSCCFGCENAELIRAVQLQSDVEELMFQFTDLLDIDPGLMAIISKCLMELGRDSYRKLSDLSNDLEKYLCGRSIELGGVDFHRLILSWKMRKTGE